MTLDTRPLLPAPTKRPLGNRTNRVIPSGDGTSSRFCGDRWTVAVQCRPHVPLELGMSRRESLRVLDVLRRVEKLGVAVGVCSRRLPDKSSIVGGGARGASAGGRGDAQPPP